MTTLARLPKRERTRAKLIAAGLTVLAKKGEALTAADVVTAAEVSNGTFYNHFEDRDAFLDVLAKESLRALTVASAKATAGADPAWRFAVATAQVLSAGHANPFGHGRCYVSLNGASRPRKSWLTIFGQI